MEFNVFPGLSDREAHVLRLATKGFTDKEICQKLQIAHTTIRTYWARIRTKLKAVNRAQAIAEAMGRCADLKTSENKDFLASMLEASGVGMIEMDINAGSVTLHGRSATILGFTEVLGEVTYDAFVSRIIEEDRTRFHQCLLASINHHTRLVLAAKVLAPSGKTHTIGFFGSPTITGEGTIARFPITVTEVGGLARELGQSRHTNGQALVKKTAAQPRA